MSEAEGYDFYAPPTGDGRFAVGGVRLKRPFRIARLGHFGLNLYAIEDGIRFYTQLLGLSVADISDASERYSAEELARIDGPPIGAFLRYGSDHHAMVLFNRSMRELGQNADRIANGVTVNQITWQCGSLGEIGDANRWLRDRQLPIVREGRDMPGSNWHVYVPDPDGHVNELYYGIEQIGWDGHSKPWAMHDRAYRKAPPLPQVSEYLEVEDALARGIDSTDGYRFTDRPKAEYDVDGILLPQPFKVVRFGPVRLFVDDMAAALRFYRDTLGLTPTEDITWNGHRCHFLRANTEHHCVGLYPVALRAELDIAQDKTLFSIGMQVANYRQLRAARTFLSEKGCTVTELPPELFPGIDHNVLVRDPDGHAVQLYWQMEQIGWDGKPRPAAARRRIAPGDWPETLDAASDSYMGEPYLGPWG